MKDGEQPPFDVHNIRTIFYGLDLSSGARARDEIGEYVTTLEQKPLEVQTPISMFKTLERIPENEEANANIASEILPLVYDIARTSQANRDDIQYIRGTVGQGRSIGGPAIGASGRRIAHARHSVDLAMESYSPYGFVVLVSAFQSTEPWIYDLGMEAFRQASLEKIDNAVEIFRNLMDLVEKASSAVARTTSRDYIPEFHILFDRLIEHIQLSR